MKVIIGVRFKKPGKIYFFDPGTIHINVRTKVIVETALGEVSDDGVLGLQRAFKNAGVQTVVMSLWKVDDNATELMMEEFYRHLLRGETKRESFTKAQSAVRVKYNDPFYWAAFIMLD